MDACSGKDRLLLLAEARGLLGPAPAPAPAAAPASPASASAGQVDLNAFLANRQPRAPRQTWFSRLFGFAETDYEETKQGFELHGDQLVSTASGRAFGIGHFETPSLRALREAALAELGQNAGALEGPMRLEHWLGDVADAIATYPNAVFQAASQFNCLEFANPRVKPEVNREHCDSAVTAPWHTSW